jgi:hypothetical protein
VVAVVPASTTSLQIDELALFLLSLRRQDGNARAGFVPRVLLGLEARRSALPEHRRAPEVAIVVFDSTVPIGTGQAVYMAARAEEVTASGDLDRGMAVFSTRSAAQGGREWAPSDVARSARLRLYRALASEQFVLSPQDVGMPFSLE